VKQHFWSGAQQSPVVPPAITQRSLPFLQQILRFGEAQNSSSSQHFDPHFSSQVMHSPFLQSWPGAQQFLPHAKKPGSPSPPQQPAFSVHTAPALQQSMSVGQHGPAYKESEQHSSPADVTQQCSFLWQ
jgi:hypothetical protein